MVKRVVFFVHCLSDSPSSFRRVIDYEPYLRKANIEPLLLSYTSPVFYHYWVCSKIDSKNTITLLFRKFTRFTCAAFVLISRWFSLVRLLYYAVYTDGVFIQWVTPPSWYVRVIKFINKNIIFDFDDAVFMQSPEATKTIVSVSIVVSAGSHYNLEYAHKYNKRCVFLPTPVPVDKFHIATYPRKKGKIIIGWIGSISTLPHLSILSDVLDSLGEKYPYVELRVIGCGNRKELVPVFEHITCEIIPRIPYNDVPNAIINFDIGIMPLIEGDWEKGKCVGKALEYMTAGIPVVASRHGENTYAITDGVDGYLASNDEEWLNKLSLLIENAELREKIGLMGRKRVEEFYATEINAKILIDEILSHIV